MFVFVCNLIAHVVKGCMILVYLCFYFEHALQINYLKRDLEKTGREIVYLNLEVRSKEFYTKRKKKVGSNERDD